MNTSISLEGLQSLGGNEDRAVAIVKVNINNKQYNWQVYVPQGADLSSFLETVKESVVSDIQQKELAWQQLEPKTRTIKDPFTDQETVVDINKEEVVCPTMPDYYALRRNEYPSLADQLGAMWKGPDSAEFKQIQQKILDVKAKYPKP